MRNKIFLSTAIAVCLFPNVSSASSQKIECINYAAKLADAYMGLRHVVQSEMDDNPVLIGMRYDAKYVPVTEGLDYYNLRIKNLEKVALTLDCGYLNYR